MQPISKNTANSKRTEGGRPKLLIEYPYKIASFKKAVSIVVIISAGCTCCYQKYF
jgi:hypothetical protein